MCSGGCGVCHSGPGFRYARSPSLSSTCIILIPACGHYEEYQFPMLCRRCDSVVRGGLRFCRRDHPPSRVHPLRAGCGGQVRVPGPSAHVYHRPHRVASVQGSGSHSGYEALVAVPSPGAEGAGGSARCGGGPGWQSHQQRDPRHSACLGPDQQMRPELRSLHSARPGAALPPLLHLRIPESAQAPRFESLLYTLILIR